MSKRELYQSDASYHRTMLELRRRAESGVQLRYFDDDTPGNKRMGCTLGLCDEKLKRIQDGIYSTNGHICPHDKQTFTHEGVRTVNPEGQSPSGCFHRCHVFKGNKGGHKAAVTRVLAATERFLEGQP